jgi:regulator of extracellular matrix RemA (YlzA/DUF370 family)
VHTQHNANNRCNTTKNAKHYHSDNPRSQTTGSFLTRIVTTVFIVTTTVRIKNARISQTAPTTDVIAAVFSRSTVSVVITGLSHTAISAFTPAQNRFTTLLKVREAVVVRIAIALYLRLSAENGEKGKQKYLNNLHILMNTKQLVTTH